MGIYKTQEELLKAVAALPSTIKGLKVQHSLQSFQPPSTHLDMSKDLVEQTKEVLDSARADEMFLDYEIIDYSLNAYCGNYMPDTDGYYIQMETKASKKLGEKLFKGELGSLD